MCKMCEVSQQDRFAGGYDFKCLSCCVRALKKTRPLGRAHQESILEVILRVRGAPTKKSILGELSEKK
jgi:uncharacterized protein (UPF0335 family)